MHWCFRMVFFIYKSKQLIAQHIYSIYLYTELHKRKVFDQMIHIMSKRINLPIYKRIEKEKMFIKIKNI